MSGEVEQLRARLSEAVDRLGRVVKYAKEDLAVTPGSTRLARLVLNISRWLDELAGAACPSAGRACICRLPRTRCPNCKETCPACDRASKSPHAPLWDAITEVDVNERDVRGDLTKTACRIDGRIDDLDDLTHDTKESAAEMRQAITVIEADVQAAGAREAKLADWCSELSERVTALESRMPTDEEPRVFRMSAEQFVALLASAGGGAVSNPKPEVAAARHRFVEGRFGPNYCVYEIDGVYCKRSPSFDVHTGEGAL